MLVFIIILRSLRSLVLDFCIGFPLDPMKIRFVALLLRFILTNTNILNLRTPLRDYIYGITPKLCDLLDST